MSFSKNSTIAAIATAHGLGSVSIVRVSGEKALEISLKLTKKNTLKPRHATLCEVFCGGEFLDEAILIYFKAPNSFTGEDIVEFQTHGGFVISNMILNELLRLGVVLAQPGEFSKRAFLNGKLDLAKANAITAIINSRSEGAAKILARQMRGELGRYTDEIRAELVRTLAYVETSIDYADDDLPSDLLGSIKNMLSQNSQKLDKMVAISKERRGLIDGFKIAIVGKPNVGKSSILNALLKFERAIVSNEAGTTRDTIEEGLKIGTHLVKIIDTAGIRSGAGAVEEIGISYSLRAIDEADIIVAVFDGSEVADEGDKRILSLLDGLDKKLFFVLNKSDLGVRFDINLNEPIKICAKNGVDELVNEIENFLNTQDTNEIMLSSLAQIRACEAASGALKRAFLLLDESEIELFAYEINLAIKEIASITRPLEYSEVLDEMFLNFCLGK
ncbi:tRNA uridine-5-carboxymethylaminomethyl(34) synthesis GTPase MnmE [Campylobacter gastrosuis]|uniref:tRNA modification GTPase MnmE n=1 Tax=Campylobacter gastrosuis TaxID=2974576 RepID=A0ABT7HQE2_9BACT|nr:tRNA uridine-5-carboxymethylaminomethyl(34) synthesis GTPase MnmE [Campylobacter gastrosuis]MDL0089141.1 tRNA uridine-5-carboxymethylaminomethyl(34) synthesis GTPase MnmE [Campylobacter gastrosuis]